VGSTVCCANICPAPEPVAADPSRRRRQRAAAETCKCSHFRHAIPSTSHHDCALSCCVMTASCRTVQVASTAPFKLQSSELQLLQRSLRASYAFADGPCTAGARQLFWGDVHSTTDHFKALFYFLSAEVVFCQWLHVSCHIMTSLRYFSVTVHRISSASSALCKLCKLA